VTALPSSTPSPIKENEMTDFFVAILIMAGAALLIGIGVVVAGKHHQYECVNGRPIVFKNVTYRCEVLFNPNEEKPNE